MTKVTDLCGGLFVTYFRVYQLETKEKNVKNITLVILFFSLLTPIRHTFATSFQYGNQFLVNTALKNLETIQANENQARLQHLQLITNNQNNQLKLIAEQATTRPTTPFVPVKPIQINSNNIYTPFVPTPSPSTIQSSRTVYFSNPYQPIGSYSNPLIIRSYSNAGYSNPYAPLGSSSNPLITRPYNNPGYGNPYQPLGSYFNPLIIQ